MTGLERMPHDEFVKRMMSDPRVSKDFFLAHLPEDVLNKVNLDTLKMEHGLFVEADLKSRESDMLYSAQLRNGNPSYFFLLIEHQRTSDPLISFRLIYYSMQALDRHIRQNRKNRLPVLPLPLVYPLVLYNGDKKFTASRDILTLFGEEENLAREVFLKPFQLVDVSCIEDEAMRKHQWAGILEWCLYHSVARDFLPYIQDLAAIARKLHIENGDKTFHSVLHYMMSGMETSSASADAIATFRRELPPGLEKNIMTIAEQLRTEGMQQGMQQGIQQGMKQGKLEGFEVTFEALRLLRGGFSINVVAEKVGLSSDAVKKLKEEILH